MISAMKLTRVGGFAATVALAAVAAVWSAGAGAERPPFTPLPIAGNVAALTGTPAFSPPAAVTRLPADLYPEGTPVHVLGPAGYAWTRADGSTCVLMANAAGGCGSTFNEPVLLFLSSARERGASSTSVRVTGLVPNSVRRVVLVTTNGDRINAPIARNAFSVALPAGAAIAGEKVTLADGTSFFNEDPLSLPH